MIYSVYFMGAPATFMGYGDNGKWCGKNFQVLLAERIKASPKDSFICILTTEQKPDFEKFLKDNELDTCIAYQAKQGITNANYPDRKRRLHLYCLSSGKLNITHTNIKEVDHVAA